MSDKNVATWVREVSNGFKTISVLLEQDICAKKQSQKDMIMVTDTNSKALLKSELEGKTVLFEYEKPIISGLPIKAATLPAVARLLINSFDCNGQQHPELYSLPKVILCTHRWFISSKDLAEHLVSLHKHASKMVSCNVLHCTHNISGKYTQNCPVLQYQAQVCHVIRYWFQEFPVHFDSEHELADVIRDFQANLTKNEAKLLDLSHIPTYDWIHHNSVRKNAANDQNTLEQTQKVSLVLFNMEASHLAEHITYLEHKVIRRISFQEFQRYAETNTLTNTPKLERSVSMFNGLTQWIQCMVLSRTTPQERADIITKFLDIAKKLRELQNFNSLMAVIGSVSHSVLARLSKTMNCLSPDSKRLLGEFTELLSPNSNFGNYRKALHESKGFKIPILGIHLKDLISLHVALPDTVEKDMVNIHKMAQLFLIFQDLEEVQKSTPPIEVNMDLVNTLRLSLDLAYTDDEIYELSLAREPRNTSSPQCSPTQSLLFAEWASNPCPPPDPQTIEKHVNAMVEAVFKNYDTDHDGYISHEEFELVAGNFPFIASFCVLDADHDGMISKEEMKKYFIHANYHALKSGFKHDFHETTYFKPTYCAHCAGLLWGLIRQGYKCRECGINAHKHCKDLVVMECRTRSNAGDHNTHATTSRKRFRRKKKSSVSESESSPPSPKHSVTSYDSDLKHHSIEHIEVPAGGGSLPASPKPAVMLSGPRRKISDSLLVPPHNRPSTRLRAQHSCPESTCHHKPQDGGAHFYHPPLLNSSALHRPPLSHQSAVTCPLSEYGPTPINEQIEVLQKQVKELEEAKQRLERENHALEHRLQEAYRDVSSLREEIGKVREQTVTFIMTQMDTLHLQKDTHV